MSNLLDIKKMLKESLEIEERLYDFAIECLKEIFLDDKNSALSNFEYMYQNSNEDGFYPSLRYFRECAAREKKAHEEWEAKLTSKTE